VIRACPLQSVIRRGKTMYDKYGQLYRHWSIRGYLLTEDLTMGGGRGSAAYDLFRAQPMACSQAAALALSSVDDLSARAPMHI